MRRKDKIGFMNQVIEETQAQVSTLERKSNISVFVERLKRMGIEVELAGNFPWIYLNSVNGKRVKETFQANHGFTVAYYPRKSGEKDVKFTDIGEIFKLLRKYT